MLIQEKTSDLIKYDALNKEYKSIKGAVCSGDRIAFKVGISSQIKVDAVYFVLKDIDKCENEMFLLDYICNEDEFNYFGFAKSFINIGIYEYCFYVVNGENNFYIELNDGFHADITYHAPNFWQLSICKKEYPNVTWANGKLMYQIFPDRFFSYGEVKEKEGIELRLDWGNTPDYLPNENGEITNCDMFGGNLKGIISKLDYLVELGVGAIYLNPIFESPSNHKYDTADYSKIDCMFGSKEDFINLTSLAHKKGIRVILDGVFNHTGSDSLYFNKKHHYSSVGAYESKESPYYDWYTFKKWPNSYESWWDFETLPALNGKSESLQEFFCGQNGIIRKWLNLGADGWRLDVVDEICDEMLNKITACIKQESCDKLIIGEVWEDASNKVSYGQRRQYFYNEQLDSVMNYPMRNAIIGYIKTGNAFLLKKTNFLLQNNYPKHVLDNLMNILGTHDTSRLITELCGDNIDSNDRQAKARTRLSFEQYNLGKIYQKLAVILQYTLSGFPCVYYGDEVSMQGYNDPFCRGCYPWQTGDKETLSFYKKMGSIRKLNVFKTGDFNELIAHNGIYAFERVDQHEQVIVIVNRSQYCFNFEVLYKYIDLLTDISYTNKATVEPNSAVILYKRK